MVCSNTFFTEWLTLRAPLEQVWNFYIFIAVHLVIHRNIHSDVCILSGVTIDHTVYVLLPRLHRASINLGIYVSTRLTSKGASQC